MTSSVVVIHIGQAGIQMGNALWELFCIEHSITPDGEFISETEETSMNSFFQEVNDRKFIPRAICIDSESIVVDEIRTGVYRQLYHPDQLISGSEDAANNFARGSFLLGGKFVKKFVASFQKLIEQIDDIDSVIFMNSFGGGSGSGMGSLFLQQIANDFPKVCKVQIPISQSPVMSTAIVDPYNAILHAHTCLDVGDLSVMFDNEALYDMCQNLLFITSPTYNDVNKLIAMILSSITCSIRFHSSIHTGIREMYTNLIPYPRIHFAIASHAPIQQKSRGVYSTATLEQMTKDVFSKVSQSISCDINRGKYIAILMNYRGMVNASDVSNILFKYKSANTKFVEWCPTGFKLCINHTCPTVIPGSDISFSDKSVTSIFNSTAVKEPWSRMARKFELLYYRRSFLHWYINEGMEETEFGESIINIQLLTEDYDEIALSEKEITTMLENNPSMRSRSMSLRMEPTGKPVDNLDEDLIA